MKIKNRNFHKKRYLEKRLSGFTITVSPLISNFSFSKKYRDITDSLAFYRRGFL